ncbi:hypothetical protein BV898_18666 [Hypsibius exemplaris]|uniref:Uncharacterized protein n=1 Tax=Hypsibius exemplaris TaxID=2072580 RepID=A0A9X6NHC6_HYPEX|nr:hypothetical protein BV898_18666 [Hypsibius exemplaris]
MGKKPASSLTSNDRRLEELASLNQLAKSYLSRKPDSLPDSEQSLLQAIGKYSVRGKRTRISWRVAAFIGGLLLSSFCLWFFIPRNVLPAVLRLSLIQILPYWDWTHLKDVPCLWKKPEDVPETVQNTTVIPDHCVVCEDLIGIYERPGGTLNAVQVGDDFLVEQLPLILRKVFMVEPEGPSLRLNPILKLHLDDESLIPCRFLTNLRTKQAFQFNTFLHKVQRKDLQVPWFGFWEFCEHHHIKECRPIIPRPPELPTMLEIADSFWFFTASNFTSIKYKFVDLSYSVFWYTQMSGSSKIRLSPKPPCHEVCHSMDAELHPGDALLTTTDLFEVSWMPGPEGEVLAVAAGAL